MRRSIILLVLSLTLLVPTLMSQSPRMEWRCLMLDSGRQYHRMETLKWLIDSCAALGMNKFHWHLTEGLGWRLDVPSYPRLASVGAFVADGAEQQGFYSEADVKELIDYAAARGIDIVPEIDIPGHAEAALTAYPEWSCRGVAPEIPRNGFTDNILCAGNDSVIETLHRVLDDVCRLFPSEFIHLGGDEAPKMAWEACPKCQQRIRDLGLKDEADLQAWFAREMAEYLTSKGRRAIFWEDVLRCDPTYPIPTDAVIQWWDYRYHGTDGLYRALSHGHQVICSPNYYTYLNFPETPWRGYDVDRTFTLEDAYLRNPVDTAFMKYGGEIRPDGTPCLLGITCALWTDYNLTEDMLYVRLFPRIRALAELMLRQPDNRKSISDISKQ